MTLPTASVAAERFTTVLTSVDFRAAELITSAALSDRNGNDDEPIIVDDQYAVDSDAAAPTGLEDPQFFSLADDVLYQRIAVDECVHQWLTASFVEPRFLRYARLLN